MDRYFYTGSYAQQGQAGIVRYRLDTATGEVAALDAYCGVQNPSYVALNADASMLYAVEETVPEGKLHALRPTPQGLVPVESLPTEGGDPCHIGLTDEWMLLVSNYASGSLAMYALDRKGVPLALQSLCRHKGHSAHPTRQASAHVHFAQASGEYVFVADLGLDRVLCYDVPKQGEPLPGSGVWLQLPPGSGPRHLAFGPQGSGTAYVVCELSNRVAVFRKPFAQGSAPVQMISTLPEGYRGESIAAAIHRQGEWLFASNRGHDSIAVFRIQHDGTLALLHIEPTGGQTPRDFAVMGEWLVVANQDSQTLTVLHWDAAGERLRFTGQSMEAVKPTCVCPVPL